MWERFSFYGMRALLILYLTQHLIQTAQSDNNVTGFTSLQSGLEALYGPLSTQALASHIYGMYTSLVYFTPFFGGVLADRLLGQRNCVVLGAMLMAIGHFLMIAESCFLLALIFLILGSGCFKPNISTQVGKLYTIDDPRRDGAFTLFYMGINLGAFFSPLICGSLGQLYGWHYGFSAAGIGMLLGLLIYLAGQKHLIEVREYLSHQQTIDTEMPQAKQWQIITGLLALAILNIVFWAVYEQQGNTLQLFAEYQTDREIFGWEIPSTWFQSLNPALIFLLAPLLDRLSRLLSKKNREPSSIVKMAIGCWLLGGAFLVLTLAVNSMESPVKISLLWLVLCTFIYTLGELYLSPTGLSLVSKVSPARLVGMLMGVWFLSSFFGNYLSGYIGSYYDKLPKESFFLMLAGLAISTGLAIFALQLPLKKAIGKI